MKGELAELNRSLLARLAQSRGDILADAELIESLDSTKSTASRIAAALASAATLQVRLPYTHSLQLLSSCFWCCLLSR